MYTYYLIRMDFDNGVWGYLVWDTGGRWSITDDKTACLVFDTHDEALQYYYDRFDYNTTLVGRSVIRNGSSGAKLEKAFVTTVTSTMPM